MPRRVSRWRACAALLVASLVAPVQALAQQPSAPLRELLTSPEALATWLATHSYDARAAEARVEQAQAAYGASLLRPNPQLTASFGGIPAGTTNPPGLGWGDTVNYGATLSQLFEIGKRQPRGAAARLRLTSQQHALAGTLLESLADAREAIARVLHGRSRKAALAEELDTARQVVDLQRVRFDRGDLSGIDFDRLQLDAQMLDADLAQASAELQEAVASCARILFASCDGDDADLDVVTAQLQPLDAVPPADWQATLQQRPDLQSLDAQRQATEQDTILALRRRVPDPIVSLGYTRDYFAISGNNPRTLALGVTIPLPTFDRGKQDAARATAAGHEIAENAAAIAARARSDIDALRARQTAIGTVLDALRGDALTRANSILASTSDAVNQGELSTTDLLLARRARTDVTLRTMDLQLQLFLVQNELRQALGVDAPVVRRIQGVTWPTP
jgi:cobalt-zinc-cadmium efflux system outer membrane protein